MAIRTTGIIPGYSGADFVRMKSQFSDLQRQLGTGQKSTSYGGLGVDSSLALSLQGSLSQISSWQNNITMVQNRIKIMDTALNGIQTTVTSSKAAMLSDDFTLSSGRTVGQMAAGNSLDAIIGMLNSSDGSRYLFGGRQTAVKPVQESAVILNGQGAKAGFYQTQLERMQADLGSSAKPPETDANATGRLTLSAAATTPVTLAEDGTHPFGLKFANAPTGSIGGVTTTYTAGPPGSVAFDAGPGTTAEGDSVTITFKLPDGTTDKVTLKAVAADADHVNPGEFKIGATQADTLDNLRSALKDGVAKVVTTSLAASSAVQAGEDFFKGETNAAALAGPPAVEPGVAKRLVPGASGTMADAVAFDTPANADARTVRWYQGDRSSNARATATAQVDSSITVSYGAQADEEALRSVVQNLAVAGSLTFKSDDTNGLARYQAFKERVASGLSGNGQSQTLTSLRVDIASANTAADDSKSRHKDTGAMMTDLLAGVTTVSNEEVAAQILALQTMMQASYQTSSMMSKLSLVNFL
jgi:flagellar hook-associated protein 3 FlgL